MTGGSGGGCDKLESLTQAYTWLQCLFFCCPFLSLIYVCAYLIFNFFHCFPLDLPFTIENGKYVNVCVCVKANANQTNYKNIFIFCLSWRLCRGKTSMFSAKKNLNFLFLFFNLKFPSSEGEPSRRPKRKIELHKIIILICAWDESLR